MISDHNLPIQERAYRDLNYPSYSMLAAIAKHGLEVVMGVKNMAFNLIFGSLVDDLCFEPGIVREKYYEGQIAKSPSGHPKKIVDELLTRLESNMTTNPFVKIKLPSTALKNYKTEICAIAKQQKVYGAYTDDKIMQAVLKAARLYFKGRLESKGKIFVNKDMWAKAIVTAHTLKTHPFSKKYFDRSLPHIEIFYQYKFIVEVCGEKTKGMLDCVLVDHKAKIIYPVDLKTGEAPVEHFDQVMLTHKYYIQAALYRSALQNIVAKDPDLDGYKVAEFEFLYISKENEVKPLIWVVPEELHEASMNGFFDVYGFAHKGVKELLKYYYDCKRGNHCIYDKELTRDKGRVMLDNIVRR
jgi:hypothetical protein